MKKSELLQKQVISSKQKTPAILRQSVLFFASHFKYKYSILAINPTHTISITEVEKKAVSNYWKDKVHWQQEGNVLSFIQ